MLPYPTINFSWAHLEAMVNVQREHPNRKAMLLFTLQYCLAGSSDVLTRAADIANIESRDEGVMWVSSETTLSMRSTSFEYRPYAKSSLRGTPWG